MLFLELRAYAGSICVSRDDAEDLVQNANERSLRAGNRPSRLEELRPWMFRIIRNLHYDALQKRRVRREYLAAERRLSEEAGRSDAARDVLVRLAYEKLPPDTREVLCLVDIMGLTYAEVAMVLNIPIAGVASGLTALRPGLADRHARLPVAPPLNRRPAGWLMAAGAAAALALGAFFGPDLLRQKSLFDLHAELADDVGYHAGPDVRVVGTASLPSAPDLARANLLPIAHLAMDGGSITHYAGQNGCRLSYFRGVKAPLPDKFPAQVQVAVWESASAVQHIVVATGMDPTKFDVIASYLKRASRQEATEDVLASLARARRGFASCVG